MLSDDYYAFKKLDAEKRAAAHLVLSLFDKIIQIPFSTSDDQLVRIKLRWWKEEMIKTQQHHASHPWCIQLSQLMDHYQCKYDAWLQMITAIETIVQNTQFQTEQSLRDFYTYTYGIRERILAKILNEKTSHFPEAIHHGAYALALIDNLKHLRQRALKMYVFFSDEETRNMNIDKNLILTLKMTDALKQLCAMQIEKAQKHFALYIEKYKEKTDKAYFPLRLRIQLGLAWCEQMRQRDFPLLTQKIELSPLRKWWITLKTQAD